MVAGSSLESTTAPLAHERRNPDLTARPSDRPWRDVALSAMRQVRSLLGQLVDLRNQMADLDDASLLRALNLIDRDDRLLIAGEILLCTPQQDVLDILTRPAAGAEPSVRRLREPLVLLLPHALDSIRATIDPEIAHVALAGGQEIALPDFSPIAVDEAVTNALVHRDYSQPERVVIDHSPNALRVWSPGGLPFGDRGPALEHGVDAPQRNPHGGHAATGTRRAGLARDRSDVPGTGSGRTAGTWDPRRRILSRGLLHQRCSQPGIRRLRRASLPRTLRENVDAMLSLVHLCQRSTLTLADASRLLQVSDPEAKDRIDALGTGTDALIERDGDARRGVRWRLRPSVASALGTAVQHRARADSARPRVEAHLKEYGWITNRTIRNMFDLDVQQATQILNELRAVNVVIKDPDGPQRGPSIRWLPAKPMQAR